MFSAFGIVTPSEKWLIGSFRLELAFVHELQKHADDERLGVAADTEVICCRQGPVRREVRVAEAVHVASAGAVPHADQHAWNRGLSAIGFPLFFDGGDNRRLGRWRRHRDVG